MVTEYVKTHEIDLLDFRVEGEINSYYSLKGFPTRVRCHWVHERILHIELRQFVLAVYCVDTNSLYRLECCTTMHWMLIKRAITNMYPGVKIIE